MWVPKESRGMVLGPKRSDLGCQKWSKMVGKRVGAKSENMHGMQASSKMRVRGSSGLLPQAMRRCLR